MDADIMQWVDQATPYLTAAVGAYGAAVLTRVEADAADATVSLGRRILQAVWSRQDESGRSALEEAVAGAAAEPDDPDTAAVLRRQLKRALREDPDLRAELTAILRTAATTSTGVSAGHHSPVVSHSRIGGDNIQVGQVGGSVTIGPASPASPTSSASPASRVRRER
jgi:hypothetical protein